MATSLTRPEVDKAEKRNLGNRVGRRAVPVLPPGISYYVCNQVVHLLLIHFGLGLVALGLGLIALGLGKRFRDIRLQSRYIWARP